MYGNNVRKVSVNIYIEVVGDSEYIDLRYEKTTVSLINQTNDIARLALLYLFYKR